MVLPLLSLFSPTLPLCYHLVAHHVGTWIPRDDAYESIRQGLLRLLPVLQAETRLLVPAVPVSSRFVGFQARDLPGEYVARPTAVAEIKCLLLGEGGSQTTAITTALRGAGGFGKTTLALALCHDPEIQAAFPDGILWVELGEHPPRTLDLLNGLLASLRAPGPTAITLEEALETWRAALSDKTCLLVIDDVWQMDALKPLLEGGPCCKRLVTTRNDQVLPAEAARVVVDAMSPQEAIAVLCQDLPIDIQQASAQSAVAVLVKRLGYWPLLLSMARGLLVTQLRYGRSLVQALAVVEQVYQARQGVTWQQGEAKGFHETMDASLQASLRQLQEVVPPHYRPLERYQELAIFPEDTDIPIADLDLFWKATAGLEPWEVDDLCMQLQSLSLVLTCDFDSRTIRLHDVLRTYLVQRVGSQLPLLHARFLDAVRQGLHVQRWADVPPENAYLWNFLAWHLCQAARWKELHTILTDVRFLAASVLVRGVASLEADLLLACNAAAVWQDSHEPVLAAVTWQVLQHCVGKISHLMRQVNTLSEIGGLLLAHLGWEETLSEQRQHANALFAPPFVTAWHPLPQVASAALIRILTGHTDPVRGCTFSPDGTSIVSASDDGTLKVWDATSGGERLSLIGHTDRVYCCAFSPDGRFIVSASSDRTLKVWDATSGAECLSLIGHTSAVRGCVFSPDSRSIVSASYDGTLKVWDAASGGERFSLSGHTAGISCCTFSPDGRSIVSASDDRTLKMWDAASGGERFSLSGHTAFINGCTFSPDGTSIVSASDDGTLKVWDAASGGERLSLIGHTDKVYCCAFSPDGRFIVSASDDGTLRVWNAASGAERFSLSSYGDRVNGCIFSPDGRSIVSASDDGTLRVWDAASGKIRFSFFGHMGGVNSCIFSPDGRSIVSASSDRTLSVRDAASGKIRFSFFGHMGGVSSCSFSPDGRSIVSAVSASDDGALRVWDAASGAERFSFSGHSYNFSPDGRSIISAFHDGMLKVWNAASGEIRFSFFGHMGGVSSCSFSPDGRSIVSASNDGALRVWDAASGETRFPLSGHMGGISGCVFSPNSRSIVSTSNDDTLKVWNVASGKERFSLSGHMGGISGCVFSPNSHFFVSASNDGSLKVWDAAFGTECVSLTGHAKRVPCCAFSPDSRSIVSVSHNGTLKVWEVQTGRCVLTFPVDGELTCCAFHPDGEHLVACGAQGIYFLRLVV